MNRTNVLLLIAPAISIVCAIGCGDDGGTGGGDGGRAGNTAQTSGSTAGNTTATGPGGSGTTDASSATSTSTASSAATVSSSSTGNAACGAPGEACCGGNACDPEATCTGGTCVLTCDVCDTACEAGACLVASRVAGGHRFGCTLLSNGSVRCWGNNESCELGDGTDTDRWQPRPVLPAIANVVAIASAPTDAHSCAVTASGAVWCWGSNYLGQLGGDPDPPCHPVEVEGLPMAAAEIAVGGEGAQGHSCARLVDGTVWCWGKTGGLSPTQVASVTGATAIAVGGWHACAVVNGGEVRCWGQNVRGQLGTGSFDAVVGVGVVTGVTNATSLALGRVHSCARLADGTAACWGDNDDGKLGIGPAPEDVATPTAVSGLAGVAKVSAGYDHTCALLDDGTARCWGDNILGQLGINSFDGQSNVPVEVSTLVGAADIAVGGFHTCAVVAGGDLTCWGYNQAWQLGSSGNSLSIPHAVEWQ